MRTTTLATALLTWTALLAQSVPVYYWPLDELGGTVANEVISNSDGHVQGNTNWQPTGGHHGGALRFNGNDARVDLGPCDVTSGPGDQLSLACWFKPEIVSGTERILMAKTLGPNEDDFIWSLSLVNNTGARFRIKTSGVLHTIEIPPSNIFTNTWYHLAATYDNHGLRLFLNGSTAANGTAEGAIGYHPEASASLGNLYDNSLPFYGSLDDVRIYDHEIVGLEVIDLCLPRLQAGRTEGYLVATGKVMVNGTTSVSTGARPHWMPREVLFVSVHTCPVFSHQPPAMTIAVQSFVNTSPRVSVAPSVHQPSCVVPACMTSGPSAVAWLSAKPMIALVRAALNETRP